MKFSPEEISALTAARDSDERCRIINAATQFILDTTTHRSTDVEGLGKWMRRAQAHLDALLRDKIVAKDAPALIARFRTELPMTEDRLEKAIAAAAKLAATAKPEPEPPVPTAAKPTPAPVIPAPVTPVVAECASYADWMRLSASSAPADKAAARKIYNQHRAEIDTEIARREALKLPAVDLTIPQRVAELVRPVQRAIDAAAVPAHQAKQLILDRAAREELRHFDESIEAIHSALKRYRAQPFGSEHTRRKFEVRARIAALEIRLREVIAVKSIARQRLLKPKP